MHYLTRVTLQGCAVIVSIGLAVALVRAASPRSTFVVASPEPSSSMVSEPLGLDPTLTQRKGEWSPICAKDGEPLIDFAPVDRNTTLNRILLTVHNCSEKPVKLGEPMLWQGGKESMSEHLRLDPERTSLTALTLEPWESAQAVLSWEPTGYVDTQDPGILSVRWPGIGEGELQEQQLGLTSTSLVWLSGWTR